MASADQHFDQFRCDFIQHLSVRFGLAPELVAARLGGWLRAGRGEPLGDAEISRVRPSRTRR